MRVAIPTHRRAGVIEGKTLAFVRQHLRCVPVDLFLSDEEDGNAYAGIADANRIITGAKNIREKWNFIHYHYPIGEEVLVMEDDIEAVVCKTGENEKEEVRNFKVFAEHGFWALQERRAGLFGFQAHDNAFYMKYGVGEGLKFCVANMFGFISNHKKALEIECPSKTDYERTIKYFIEYGKVLRFDHVGIRTKNYRNAGGMQADLDRRQAMEEESVAWLCARYPHLIRRNEKKKSLYPEVLLRRPPAGADLKGMQRVLDAKLGGAYAERK